MLRVNTPRSFCLFVCLFVCLSVDRSLSVGSICRSMGCSLKWGPAFMKALGGASVGALRGGWDLPNALFSAPRVSVFAPSSIRNVLKPTVPDLIAAHRITFPSSGCEVKSVWLTSRRPGWLGTGAQL